MRELANINSQVRPRLSSHMLTLLTLAPPRFRRSSAWCTAIVAVVPTCVSPAAAFNKRTFERPLIAIFALQIWWIIGCGSKPMRLPVGPKRRARGTESEPMCVPTSTTTPPCAKRTYQICSSHQLLCNRRNFVHSLGAFSMGLDHTSKIQQVHSNCTKKIRIVVLGRWTDSEICKKIRIVVLGTWADSEICSGTWTDSEIRSWHMNRFIHSEICNIC